ncbi:hypothetical protein MANES_13G077620v8 [Manihot esculenta]|uniref:Uncharacterized protein n=1 Tax=Manihot esculenta TaxID=3983 RepID=A0ACB7GLQ1_MANES|nr:hypothetical protein MANES_13G077620v8 [Manihot esculenta]
MGDKILLRLQPYRQTSIAKRRNHKLSARFYGPFVIVERVSSMAYKLDLPADSKLHLVFHISSLKPYHEGQSALTPLLPSFPLPALVHPLAILDHRIKAGSQEVLVHWNHSSPVDALWEKVQAFSAKYLDIQLEDKLPLGPKSNVTKPLQVYTRFSHGSKSKQPHIESLN